MLKAIVARYRAATRGWSSRRWESSRRRRELAAAEHVNVEEVHRLPRVRAGIDHRAVAAGDALRRGDLRGGEHDLSHERRIARFVERRDVYAGDHEHMRRRPRIDVAEGDGMLVLPYDPGGNLAAH